MKGACERCLAYDVDQTASCEACAAHAEDRSRSLGGAILAFVAVAYLATIAVGVLVFRARPFIGGLAAIVAIALGRTLQTYVKPPVVTGRSLSTRSG
ncbi:MAG: hypothetical protein K0S65_3419 [Labilithrix sp.]|nr:hypothetical protein [Labilithrix sp.]